MSKFDDILARLKGFLEEPESKVEGTFSIFNLRAVAQEMALLRNEIEILNNNWALDSAAGVYLDKVADAYGVNRKGAQYAGGTITFSGVGTLAAGTVLTAKNGLGYMIESDATVAEGVDATVNAQCTSLGAAGNMAAGGFTVQLIDGTNVTLAASSEFSGGYDRESDDEVRRRVYDKIRYPATSGNVAHYKQWALEVSGVGAVKVFPLWNGAGTVKVSIIDANGMPASSTLVQTVQDYIDPDEGKGGGCAPIGAIVTVTTAEAVAVNVAAKVELGTTGDLETAKAAFTAALTELFAGYAYDGVTDGVSAAIVGRELIDTVGVVDYADLTLNGGTAAITVGAEEVLTVGTVTLEAVSA